MLDSGTLDVIGGIMATIGGGFVGHALEDVLSDKVTWPVAARLILGGALVLWGLVLVMS
jgi:hypothetical protein